MKLIKKVIVGVFALIGVLATAFGVLLWWVSAGALDQGEPEEWGDDAGQGQVQVSAELQDGLSGHWLFADGEAGRERVSEAVQDATSDLGRVGRTMVRRQFVQDLEPQIDDAIEIELGEDTIDLQMPICPAIEDAPVGGSVEFSCQGLTWSLTHKLDDGGEVILQRMKNEQARVYRRFVLEAEDRLRVEYEIQHGRLSKPLRFDLRYRRDNHG